MHPLFFICYQLSYEKRFSFFGNSRADYDNSCHCMFKENSKTNQDKDNPAKNLHSIAK
jgi:hypothetical protein